MARGAEQGRASVSARKDRADGKRKKTREETETSTDSDDEKAAEREAKRERETERKGTDWQTQRKLSILWIARLKRLKPRSKLNWLSWLQFTIRFR